ncbi:hypothetical protein V495_06394 [Pseudogymnoascus sp. VKM F-4514 (FW-929)]|nr:hypothetical protein V490_08821 [Pseudogymnoascus sp. VKM F-3557]KFY38747.1 hypothetical protein V495_06394 [Pseudogymnoascus sp. VKM F-4514 (FW-929)]
MIYLGLPCRRISQIQKTGPRNLSSHVLNVGSKSYICGRFSTTAILLTGLWLRKDAYDMRRYLQPPLTTSVTIE